MAVRGHRLDFQYVTRLSAQDDPDGLDMFDALVELAQRLRSQVGDAGLLGPDLDLP